MIRFLLIAVLAAAMTACGNIPERRVRVETVEVKVPVKVACIEAKPAEPEYQWGKGPYPGHAAAVGIMATDLEAAKQYGRDWEAAAVGCTKPAQ